MLKNAVYIWLWQQVEYAILVITPCGNPCKSVDSRPAAHVKTELEPLSWNTFLRNPPLVSWRNATDLKRAMITIVSQDEQYLKVDISFFNDLLPDTLHNLHYGIVILYVFRQKDTHPPHRHTQTQMVLVLIPSKYISRWIYIYIYIYISTYRLTHTHTQIRTYTPEHTHIFCNSVLPK